MRRIGIRARRIVGAFVGALLVLLLVTATAATAADPLQIYFSGNTGPDGQSLPLYTSGLGSTFVSVCANNTATVSVTVQDSTGTTVRTLATNQTVTGVGINPLCGMVTVAFGVSWDGAGDAGAVLPDGLYAIVFSGTDAAGSAATAMIHRRIDRRLPGTLMQPTTGSSVTGSMTAIFQPSGGLTITGVTMFCFGALAAQSNGTWQATTDSSRCGSGSVFFYETINYNDVSGSPQIYSTSITLSITNPPQPVRLELPTYEQRGISFSPNGDGYEDTTRIAVCLSATATINATVSDSTGAVVKTLASGLAAGGGFLAYCYGPGWNWDGLSDAASAMSDGTYTITVTANDGTATASVSTTRVVDRRPPGTLTAPTTGSAVTGPVTATFTPTPGFFTPTGVTVSPDGVFAQNCLGALAAQLDGTWSITASSTACPDGSLSFRAWATYNDAAGFTHTGPTAAVVVTVANLPFRLVEYTQDVPSGSWVLPNDVGVDATASGNYCISRPALVTVLVTDGSGALVRTVENALSHPSTTFLSCDFSAVGLQRFSWDGKNDAGLMVADGLYTVTVSAIASDGSTGSISTTRYISNEMPGVLTSPSSVVPANGLTPVVFTPNPGFTQIGSVFLYCPTSFGSAGGATLTRQTNGTWTAVMDATNCPTGAQRWSIFSQWTDPSTLFHNSQWSTPVTVAAPPIQVQVPGDPNGRWFSPNGDGVEDTTNGSYCLTAQGTVDISVLDANGATTKALERGVVHASGLPGLGCNPQLWTWDGTTDAGAVALPGRYQILIHATDAHGGTSSASVYRVLDLRVPGTLSRPVFGTTAVGWPIAVSVDVTPGIGVTSVQVACPSPAGPFSQVFLANGGASWSGSAQASQCATGLQSWLLSVGWVEGSGFDHLFNKTVDVLLSGPPSPASFVTASPTALPADGVSSAHVTVRLTDASGVPIVGAYTNLYPSSYFAQVTGGAATDVTGTTSWDIRDSTPEDVQLVLSAFGVVLSTQPVIAFTSPPTFTAASPPSPVAAGSAFSYQFAATGVPLPTVFSLASGSLPPGLNLAASGLLSGTPTMPGTYTFTVSTSTLGGYAETPPIAITIQGSDLTLSMMAPTFVAGSDVVIALRVGNVGNITARGPITIVGSLPAGLTYRSAKGEDLRCTAVGSMLACVTTNPVRAGRSTTIKVTVHVSARVGKTLTLSMTVSSKAFDPVMANNSASITRTIARH